MNHSQDDFNDPVPGGAITPTATSRATRATGQKKALSQVRASLAPSDSRPRLVLIKAVGGMGKTRLLEDVLARVNHPNPEWRRPGVAPWPAFTGAERPIVIDLIDLIDTRLHDRNRFIAEVHDRLDRDYGLTFPKYRQREERLRELVAGSSSGSRLERARKRAARAFVADLRRLTEGHDGVPGRRVVLILDTVERLNYEMLNRLLLPGDKSLLRSSDLMGRTAVWLISLWRRKLRNVTLVLAGRQKEGKAFFDRMADAADNYRVRHETIPLEALTEAEIGQFFTRLRDDQKTAARAAADPAEAAEHRRVAAHYDAMAKQAARLDHYTGGVPVRLFLYSHIVKAELRPPRLWQVPVERARALAPAADEPTQTRWVRWRIEDGFINLIFNRDRAEDLTYRVLLALVRAPRGLTAEQLHYVLDDHDDTPPAEWTPNSERLAEILNVLRGIEASYLGKRRSSWDQFAPFLGDVRPAEAATRRVALQDEIYDVFAEHMGLLAEPVTAEMQPIIDLMTPEQRDDCLKRHHLEQEERRGLYARLSRWAAWRHETLRAHKRQLLEAEESAFERELRLHNPRTYAFARLTEREVRERAVLNMAITQFDIERMVYDLLNSAEWSLNTAYITLEDDNDRATREEADFWAQAEMWRTLNDNHLMKFVRLDPRQEDYVGDDKPIDILRRVAEQENVTRCIKRFILRGDFQRAIDFTQAVEARLADRAEFAALSSEVGLVAASGLPPDRREAWLMRAWSSWRHTVAHAERLIWCNVAHIRLGHGVAEAIAQIAAIVPELEARDTADRATPLASKSNPGHVEYGFRGVVGAAGDDPQRRDHPGRLRLRRLIAHAYANMAYGYRLMGRMQTAADFYAAALDYMRAETEHDGAAAPIPAFRAAVLNGAARAHSELGTSAIDLCHSGLELRREAAEEVPLASSFNTLAILYDDMGRFEDAPPLSAKSIAYCRRARETRQLGFSLLQMAESLRHLADRVETLQRLAVTPEDYFDAAEGLLRRARRAFKRLKDDVRLAEVNIETGSLFRDRMGHHLADMRDNPAAAARADLNFAAYARRAEEALGAALAAIDHERPHAYADAAINLAHVRYLHHRYHEMLAAAAPPATRVAAEAARDAARASFEQAVTAAETMLLDLRVDPDDDQSPTLRDKRADVFAFAEPPQGMTRGAVRDRAWAFRQLSKVYLLYAGQAIDEFIAIDPATVAAAAAAWRASPSPDAAGPAVMDPAVATIDRAAVAYGQALRYAERYSRHSQSIIYVRRHFYNRVHRFNEPQLALLDAALWPSAAAPVPPQTFESLRRTLREFFGYGAGAAAQRGHGG